MEKIEALQHLEACIEQHLQELTQPAQPHGLVPVNLPHQLQNLRGELSAHEKFLTAAWYFGDCGHRGKEPEEWEERSGGEPFDAHTAVLAALHSLPRNGQFSPELQAYIENLPALRRHAHDFWTAHARGATTHWPGNPMQQLSELELGRRSMAVATKHLEATAFAESYAVDIARAAELASQRADWAAILDCLA